MLIRVISKKEKDFQWIVGHCFRVISRTEDNKGWFIALSFGSCRVEDSEVEEVK